MTEKMMYKILENQIDTMHAFPVISNFWVERLIAGTLGVLASMYTPGHMSAGTAPTTGKITTNYQLKNNQLNFHALMNVNSSQFD